MNKKTYECPKIIVVKLEPSEIVCTSIDSQTLRIGNLEDDDIPIHNTDDNDECVIWGE